MIKSINAFTVSSCHLIGFFFCFFFLPMEAVSPFCALRFIVSFVLLSMFLLYTHLGIL